MHGRLKIAALWLACIGANLAQAAGPALVSSKAAYWRYEFVEWTLAEKDSGISGKEFPLLAVTVKKDSQDALSFGGREILPLFYDASSRMWRGKWPLFWNIAPGDYSAQLLRPDSNQAETEIYGGPGGNFLARFDK